MYTNEYMCQFKTGPSLMYHCCFWASGISMYFFPDHYSAIL